jgi:release factor glutamine methyltransferase
LLLAILAERPLAKGLGVDISEEALAVAATTPPSSAWRAARSPCCAATGRFGLAIGEVSTSSSANPPYIPTPRSSA